MPLDPCRLAWQRLGIHATNISGAGATNLVLSLLPALLRKLSDGKDLTLFTGDSGAIADFVPDPQYCVTVVRRSRVLPNSVSRVIECMWPSRRMRALDALIILGDLPLRAAVNQIVYVHQPHLISPRVDAYASSALRYRVARFLFWCNARYAKILVVQTPAMRAKLAATYPDVADRIVVLPAPCPTWFRPASGERGIRHGAERLRLFYPAAPYPHKNHGILSQIPALEARQWPLEELILTIPSADNPNREVPWIKCVGQVAPDECMQLYEVVDGLVFLSTAESYGLPLVEAMSAGLPIICPDLEYARTLCGDSAIYFDPRRVASLRAAVEELHRRLSVGWQPDWQSMLANLPRGWDEVAERFAALIDSGERSRRDS